MKTLRNLFFGALFLLPLTTSLQGCGCGFDCNSGNDNDNDDGPALLTLGLSDSLPEELSEVVIVVDTITLSPRSGDDVIVDTFTIDSVSVDTFAIDLLQYQGLNSLVVIEDLELETGVYSSIALNIITGESSSYVVETGSDEQLQLDVSSSLVLPGFTLSSGAQQYTIEFGLAQSLRFVSDTYFLTSDGVQVQNNATSASLSGRLDDVLFDTESPCDEKSDPEMGNRVYLYSGTDIDEDLLADVFNADNSNEVPEGAVAPFAVATLFSNPGSGAWEYFFGYLPPGDYTLAFSCNTADDDSVDFDDLTIPLPSAQVYTITLSESERATCDLEPDATCQ